MKNVIKATLASIFLVVGAMHAQSCSLHDEKEVLKTQAIPPVSVQLWSVKDAVKEDFKGTLKRIADMGFSGVELAGVYGEYANDPKGLKAFLDSLNLKVSGAHLGLPKLRNEQLEKSIAFMKALGTPMVIVPGDKRADNPQEIAQLAKELTSLTKIFEKEGIAFGFHNHAKEFKPFKDGTFWDYLAKNTPDNMLLQLDVGWANLAGVNAIDYVKRYPNRTLTTHIKIRTHPEDKKPVILGDDDYDWAQLIKTMAKYGGTQWLVIEQEEYAEGKTPLESVAASKQGLDEIINSMR